MTEVNVPRTTLLGITGTDTGVGKTIVSCALAARARQLGLHVAAMKPVETGLTAHADGQSRGDSDAERLSEACGAGAPPTIVRPYAFHEPLAPFVAAQRAGVSFDMSVLDAARDALCRQAELLIVEGAGGLLVPLTSTLSFADLFARWSCELVIVAGNRLGVINHLLLTVRAAEQHGLPLRAIVLTALSERDADIAEATNFDALRTLLPSSAIYRFPWVDRIDAPDALALAAARSGLDRLLYLSRQPAIPTHR